MSFLKRFPVLLIASFFLGLGCSDAPPLAPATAGKASCALCDFLGDERYVLTEREVAAADSTDGGMDDGMEDETDGEEMLPEVLSFADDALEQAVRQALNKPHGPLTEQDVASLTVLKADDLGIESLEGLQYWTALDTLELRRNAITDVTPLASLTNLRVLHLWGNDVEDLSPLAGLTNLRTLGLWGNAVKDVSALAALDSLQWLQLGDNAVEDLSGLLGLGEAELKWLGVVDNPLSDDAEHVQVPDLRANDVVVQVKPEVTPPPCDPDDPSDCLKLIEDPNLINFLTRAISGLSANEPLTRLTVRSFRITRVTSLAGLEH